MEDLKTFGAVLYPGEPLDRVKELTAAYASIHALETIYHTRQDEESSSDKGLFDEFLRLYVSSEEIRTAWSYEPARQAFTTAFQEKRNNLMAETTRRGYTNRNGQVNLGNTHRPGTDHGQYVYVLHCRRCRKNYGVSGSDIFQRKCPFHQGGRPGLFVTVGEMKWRPHKKEQP